MEPIPSAADFPTDSEVRAALEQWFAESQDEPRPGAAPAQEASAPASGAPGPEAEPASQAPPGGPGQPSAEAAETNPPGRGFSIVEKADSDSGTTEDGRDDSTPPSDREAAIRDPRDTTGFNQQTRRRSGGRRRGGSSRRRSSQKDNGQRNTPRQTISELLREGQEIMVQVAKEPIARKGARLTSYAALPGRFMVYMPTVEHIGVSRKIESDAERLRLRKLVTELRGSNTPGGFIVRTAGANHSDKEIDADIQYLTHLWEDIRAKYEKAAAPALVHSELGLVERVIRDHLSDDFKSIRVDDEVEYTRLLDFVNRYQPSLVDRIKLFTKNVDIFDEFGINSDITRALEPKIWLKSGGYIVINQTEALVAIDVNTGKFVGKGDSLEETITRTNIEAVKEVVRQIRLRDLGGIIVIDFIDMEERKNRHKVMDALQQEITKDKSPSKILEFNEFGLVAITRKRVKQSLEKVLCQPCPYCGGSGMVRSITTVCYQIHSEIQKMARSLAGEDLAIRVHPEIAKAMRSSESRVLQEIEAMVGHEINIKQDTTLHLTHFDIII